jgi:hypothetical protein
LGGSQFKASLGKNLMRPYKPGMVTVILAKSEVYIGGGSWSEAGLGQKQGTLSKKITKAKKGWGGVVGGAPA